MAANSLPRRIAKKVLAPLLNERTYAVLQAFAMAKDIRQRTWYEPELELIDHAVRPDDTVLDIGANFGLYAHYLDRAVGRSGKVYSFEPIPFTARTFGFVGRLLRWRNVELVAKGCAEQSGKLTFTLPVMDTGAISAGLVHAKGRNDARDGKEKHARFEKTRDVECDVVAVDEFLPPSADVSLIKCDIEGADLFAMRGARRTLARCKPVVIIEINPWFLEGFGLKVADLVGFFQELGYRLYRYEGRRLHPARVEDVVEDNWVFVHPERSDRVRGLLPPQA
jgi:FkbM family methyltransferase